MAGPGEGPDPQSEFVPSECSCEVSQAYGSHSNRFMKLFQICQYSCSWQTYMEVIQGSNHRKHNRSRWK